MSIWFSHHFEIYFTCGRGEGEDAFVFLDESLSYRHSVCLYGPLSVTYSRDVVAKIAFSLGGEGEITRERS